MKRELLEELRSSWEAGRPLPVEDLIPRWPGKSDANGDVASLLFEDYLQRANQGQSQPVESYAKSFPEHKDSLAGLIRHHLISRSLGQGISGASTLRLPEVGEELFGFRIRQELGRGAFARVFLAEQADLASRLVVLKVSGIEGSEPQTLAQLQHTHIVPIYSVHEDTRAGLRALCMPYFGGASLSQVLTRLGEWTNHPTQGEQLVRALDDVGAPTPEALDGLTRLADGRTVCPPSEVHERKLAARPTEVEQTPRGLLARQTYLQAVVWIVARLAEGLHHAHQRGILHRDIKPSNILLGVDGQPMLLDFNLSHDASNAPAQATLGGTVAYMSPEHLKALATRDAALARQVDQRSDLYSLGMVLYEMIAGRSPFDQSASYTPLPMLIEAMALERSRVQPSLRQARPDVPWGLESIARRCLEPNASARYQKAEHLAEDLRRFLDDRPLLHAPELSWKERGRKWTRRHPRLTAAASVCALSSVLLLGAGLLLAGTRDHLANTQEKLATAQVQERRRAYEEGALRAHFLVNTTTDLHDHLRQGLVVCQDTLNLFGILDRTEWQEPEDWQRLDPVDRRRLAEDTRELLLLLAGARVRLAQGGPDTLAQALRLIDLAESIPDLAPCRALWLDRADYCRQLGDQVGEREADRKAAATTAHSARDHYLLAMTEARRHSYAAAVSHLNEALRINPRHYWSWMQRGLCHQERGEPTLAASDFGACIGLWPDFAWGYFNRACALARCGKPTEAILDYQAALERDPSFLSAYLNRGMLHLELKHYALALADLQRAAEGRQEDASVFSGLGVAHEGLKKHAQADQAFQTAERLAINLPAAQRHRLRWVFGFAVADRLPARARAAFESVIEENSADPQALYGCAMLLDRQGRAQESLRYFNRALDAAPGFEEARRFRALVLARRGDFSAARADMNQCLSKEPVSGATLYAAACVAALQAEHPDAGDPSLSTQQALAFLAEAFRRGYGQEQAVQDRDLDGIRRAPGFRQLLDQAGSKSTMKTAIPTP
jgi:serine/threonine protein kinase/tetratricopeptide (TPR) repeat protein